jgi:hypothetical protein
MRSEGSALSGVGCDCVLPGGETLAELLNQQRILLRIWVAYLALKIDADLQEYYSPSTLSPPMISPPPV